MRKPLPSINFLHCYGGHFMVRISVFFAHLLNTADMFSNSPYPYSVSQLTGKCVPACEDGFFGFIGPVGGGSRACKACSSKFPEALYCDANGPYQWQVNLSLFTCPY